ncbi:sigma-70 family RNA polymerase sigma factor [Muricauda sp. NFXS6]|uniref:sigma-70 family RNA polymerase sigma factor n=1 Tax=Allomuricauda sp. NFXS6 TaxID=2819094 RepID=UPI0032DED3E0
MKEEIEPHYRPLHNFVKKRVNNAQDAEDLTQEIFLKFAKSWDDKVHIHLKAWLYTIARNRITDYYRTRKTSSRELHDMAMEDEGDRDRAMEELSGCIRYFVRELPVHYRQVLQLYAMEELSQKEIAKRLDMNHATVRSKVQRGRKKLKGLIMACCEVEQRGRGNISAYTKKGSCPGEC